ncbi:MAG: UbiA family prenyltransferase [Candidatus Methanomethylophilaceae archaeon]|nr:UbiA family prenyltransferase [Candidatus Methanomethylophilaceae archaeon]
MNKYLQLFRTGNAVMGAVGVLVACFMAAGTDILSHWTNLLLSVVIVFSFIAGGNSLNDYIDADIDVTAHPERPIPSGRMSRKQAKDIGMFMLALSIMVSLFTFDVACILIVMLAVFMMVSYELYLKQRGFIGNVTIAVMTGMLFLLGGTVVGDVTANIVIASMAMLVSIGREISKDIEDKESDEGDRLTLPMRIGDRNAAIIASVCYIIGPVLSVLPIIWDAYSVLYYAVILADVVFLYCAFIVFSDPRKAQRFAKKAMILGLLSFILGVIPI